MPLSMRCIASSVCPSKRSTSTGVVLLARIRPKPSGQSMRRPSIVLTTAGGRNNCAAWPVPSPLATSIISFSTTLCGSPSAHLTFSSGVEKLVGNALSTALPSGDLLKISSMRAPAYVPSSKPNQRSLKKMCPLISPPKGAWPPARSISFIFALISECPVLYINGLPPAASIAGARRCVHFTSNKMVLPGTRESTSCANSIICRSG